MPAKSTEAKNDRWGVVLLGAAYVVTFVLVSTAMTEEADVSWMVSPGGQIVNATGDAFGNAYIIGQSGSVLIKHDRLGDSLWTHSLVADHLNMATCVAAAGGDRYVGGRTMGTTTPLGDGSQPVTGNHAFVARYGADGTLIWARLIGSTGNDIANRLFVDAESNCYIVGNTSGRIDGLLAASNGTDPFVVKLSSAGDLIWISQLREASVNSGRGVGVDESGWVTIAGEPGYVAIYDSEGHQVQYSRFSHGIPSMMDIDADGQGNAYFCGWDSPYNAIVKKFDGDGVLAWEQRFRLNGWSCPKSIAVCPDGSGDIVTGGCEGALTGGRNCQAFSRRFDVDGNLVSMCTVLDVCGQVVGVDGLGNSYVIGDTTVTKASSPVYSTAPLEYEAETAAVEGGVVETAQAGCSGDGYVSLDGNAPAHIEWNAAVIRPGMKTLVWRYRNRTTQTISASLWINGLDAASELAIACTAEDDDWMSLTAEVYLNAGENLLAIAVPTTAESGLLLDRLEVVDAEDSVARDRSITCSSQTDAFPAAAVLDGKLGSYWSASESGQWIEIDLGQPYRVSQTKLTGRSTGPCHFEVETKLAAGQSYDRLVDCRDATDALVTNDPVISSFPPTWARYVRLNLLGGSDSDTVDIQEFGVFIATEREAISVGDQGYRTIQEALDAADTGATVTLLPGLYAGNGNGNLQWDGKRLTLASVDPTDSAVVAATVIRGTGTAPVLSLSDLRPESRLAGLTVTGGLVGLYCRNASAQIEYCRIVGNAGPGIEMQVKSDPVVRYTAICGNEGAGVLMVSKIDGRWPTFNEPSFRNCTMVGNTWEAAAGGKFTMRNCIVWGNGVEAGSVQLAPVEATVTYSCVQGGFDGAGNIEDDPRFADPVDGDYHVKSQAGRWSPSEKRWIQDDVTSPCIDGGDPASSVGSEPSPNGGRVNMGVYGGTSEASKAP